MRLLLLPLLLLSVTTLAAANYYHGDVIPVLVLSDGKTLKNVEFVSYSENVLMAKWEGGRGTINYNVLPTEIAEAVKQLRPAASPTIQAVRPMSATTPAPMNIGALLAKIPKKDMTPIEEHPTWKRGPRQKISGQCFITTKGGQNIKLGGVRISVFPKEAFEGYVAQIRKRGEGRAKVLNEMADDASKQKQYSVSSMLLSMLLSDYDESWTLLPETMHSADTDADGNFTLSHEVGEEFVVFAKAQRLAGDSTERYLWRVSSDRIANPNRLFLNNSNVN